MRNLSVAEWLQKNYRFYNGNVVVSSEGKKTEKEIVNSYPELKVDMPSFSYKRYGYALSHIVAHKLAAVVGALDNGFSARLTNCGMAAISVVLDVVNRKFYRRTFVGNVLYGETRNLFNLCTNIHTISSNDLLSNDFLDQEGPSTVFVESVGNGSGMPVFDVETLFRKAWKKDVKVILDNTLLTCCLLNPFEIYAKLQEELGKPEMQFIYVESLSKHYRIDDNGMIVTAGLIIAPDNFISKVDEVIMRNGTYLQYPCLQNLPFDLLAACSGIMPQLSENAKVVASSLKQNSKVEEVFYPDLVNGAGGVIYFIVKDEVSEEIISAMEEEFGVYEGSFGHSRTTWIPFGKFFSHMRKGLIRLAVGSEEQPDEIVGRLKKALA